VLGLSIISRKHNFMERITWINTVLEYVYINKIRAIRVIRV